MCNIHWKIYNLRFRHPEIWFFNQITENKIFNPPYCICKYLLQFKTTNMWRECKIYTFVASLYQVLLVDVTLDLTKCQKFQFKTFSYSYIEIYYLSVTTIFNQWLYTNVFLGMSYLYSLYKCKICISSYPVLNFSCHHSKNKAISS